MPLEKVGALLRVSFGRLFSKMLINTGFQRG